MLSQGDASRAHALKDGLTPELVDVGYDGAKRGLAVRHAAEGGKQLRHVALGVTLVSGISGGEDPRGSAQGGDLKPGVVGEARFACQFMEEVGLDEGVALYGVGGLRNVYHDTGVVKREDRGLAIQHARDFLGLVGVVGGEKKLLHYIIFVLRAHWRKERPRPGGKGRGL